MKYCFKLTLICLFLSLPAFSEDLIAKYRVKTKGITIGSLVWNLTLDNDNYSTLISLKSLGLLSGLYKFDGKYKTTGKILNKNFIPSTYMQDWNTKKQNKKVEIFFERKKIKKLNILPVEKEEAKINYKEFNSYVDPLSSFLNIILNGKSSRTIDGRRAYLMAPKINQLKKKILIKEYINIWADHKRNDLEYIEIVSEGGFFLPKKINIKFKGSVFSLIKN